MQTIMLFVALLILPNLLGMINITTAWGFKIHTFQFAIFVAAFIYGPTGGLASGIVDSIFSATMMGNPYILVGNAILGLFAGIFIKYFPAVVAVWLAFLVQTPWLVLSDYYFMHMPLHVIGYLIIALLISNTIWALPASYITGRMK